MQAAIRAIEYYLPPTTLSTEVLAAEFPEWSVAKIDAKTGIQERHIASADQCSSDLAVAAATKLFASGACQPGDIDYILFCTQSPDYFLPTTACLIQHRLGIPTTAGALDFNLGCSGFVYGLGLCQGLISSGQARRILFLTAETYSKFIHPRDRSVRTIFGDGAAAILVEAIEHGDSPLLGPFVYGTDGSGGENLIVAEGGMRDRAQSPSPESEGSNLHMNGPEIFDFTISAVPNCVSLLLEKACVTLSDIDLFVFHQANKYILTHLRDRMHIPADKFPISLAHCGNTVSSTIPIALKQAEIDGSLQPGALVLLCGFGVGYSWAAALIRWTPARCPAAHTASQTK